MESTAVKSPRIDVVDVLRGFAIMAIMLLHNIERFNLYVFPNGFGGMSEVNRSAFDTMFFLFGGKTYSIFAILFGFTFYLQYNRQKLKGIDFGNRYLWRLLLLSGFACINAAFFPGEVLMLYAVVGVVLYFVRNWTDRNVLLLGVFFLLQPVEMFYFFKSLLDSSFELPHQLNHMLHGGVKEYLMEGSFWSLIKGNTTIGQLWSMLWAIENGRFFQTAGLFLLGLLIGRRGWFVLSKENARIWYTIIVVSVISTVLFYFLRENFYRDGAFAYRKSIGVAIDMWWKLSFTFIWISLFVLLYQTKFFKLITKPLKSYGKMSMTNYITQSIVGSILYFPFAFNLATKLDVIESLWLGVGLFLLQITFCNWWIQKYKQGPFEKAWHYLTWMKIGKK